ncbi:MAG: TVP38/TMEM64 family protein [Gemmatimonadaceae bacterium]
MSTRTLKPALASTPDALKPPPKRGAALRRLGVFLLVVAVAVAVAWHFGLFELTNRDALAAAIEKVRRVRYLPLLFVLAYAIAVTFGLPATAFTLAGGALFGFGPGLLLNWLGATIGAVLAYSFAGALCGETCRAVLGRRAEALDQLAAAHGFVGTLRLRLIPVVPFTLLNYGAALAGVRRRDYVLATALGIVPGAAVYTYFANSLIQGVEGAGRQALVNVSIAGVLLIVLSFIPMLVHRVARRRQASSG